MSRLINSFEQFFDSNGEPLASGLLEFFESGSSSVRKTTYADSGETIPNSNPVVLNGDGRAPNIFGTGTYNVILRTAEGAQIVARDPVGGDLQLTFGADWSAFQTYSITDVVRNDAQYWQSLVSGNIGNQPSTDDGSRWQLFLQGEIDNAEILANTTTRKTSTTGSSILPVGLTAQRDVAPEEGYFRANSSTNVFEGYIGGAWIPVSTDLNLIAEYAANGDAYTDSGAAGAYVLTAIDSKSAPSSYVDLMRARFVAVNPNTGASTVNVAGLGVKNIKNEDGTDPIAGRIANSTTIVYDLANDYFVLKDINSIYLGAAIATTSGTAIAFTGIPSGVKRISFMFSSLSTNAAGGMIIQLGDSGGIETTGYLGSISGSGAAENSTTGIALKTNSDAAGVIVNGIITIDLLDSATNQYVASGCSGRSDAAQGYSIGSSKSLTSELTQLRLTSNTGTAVFDLGLVNISWEF